MKPLVQEKKPLVFRLLDAGALVLLWEAFRRFASLSSRLEVRWAEEVYRSLDAREH